MRRTLLRKKGAKLLWQLRTSVAYDVLCPPTRSAISMTKQVVYSPKVTRTKAPHAHAVKTGNLVFVSGCPAFYGDMQLAKGDFQAQMRQSLTNVQNILEEAGSSLAKVVKVNIFLDRRADFDEMNEIYREFFGNDPTTWPARTTVEARLPRKDFLLEIECVAEL
jgi:2-iminobutanoate/2-iminopropanoate deaminase